MLTIYGVYRSRASRNIWLALELGLPFKHVPVIQYYRAASGPGMLTTRSPEFLAVNPNGHIPSIDDDGLVLHESLAINLYLARKHGGPLGPKDVAEDGEMGMWALWAATEIETNALNVLYHSIGKPEAERDAKILQASIEALRAPFAVLDKHLGAHGGQMVGRRFTAADINTAEVARYAQPAKELFDANPNVKAWLAACQSRPAFKKMWAARDAEPA
jgi:glutathione S-transferase